MPASLLRFDRFALDTRARLLHDGDRHTPVQAKVFELLLLLLEHPGRVFTREELIARLWPDVHVAAGSLTKAVSRLRALLGDSGVLQTAPGRGYRLVAEVQRAGSPAPIVSALLGREEALEAIAKLGEGELLMLAGPAGIGRSALAYAAGGERTIQAAEGLQVEPDALARQGGLAVIDDLHLDPRGVERVSAWRLAAPRCRWLVTAPFPQPLDGTCLWLRPLSDEQGARLLGAGDPAELRELSRALDGNPLALVLAAARLRTMTPRELLERLDKRLVLLRGLRDALERAWLLLSPAARDVLLALCAVRVPLPLAAAEVATDHQLHEVLPALVDAGWVELQPGEGRTQIAVSHNGRAWLELQPAAHAGQRLVDWLCGHTDANSRWLLEHADVLVDLASTQQGERLPELARLATEALNCRGSVRAAAPLLRRALELGQPSPTERVGLLVELGNVLRREAQFEEALAAHTQATELDPLDPKAWSERALTSLCGGHPAQELAARAVELSEGAEPEIRAHALYASYLASSGPGGLEFERLERACQVPLPSFSPMRRMLRVDLGISLFEKGRLREAEAVFREWLPEFPSAPPLQRSAVQANLGLLLCLTGRHAEGDADLASVIELARSGAPQQTALYMSWRIQGRLVAGCAWTEALAALSSFVADREPWPAGRAWVGLMAGLVALREGDPFRALARLEPTDGALFPELVPQALAGACAAHAWLGRPEDAVVRAERARQAVSSPRGALAADLACAWSLWAHGDPADPFAAFERCETPWVAPPRQRLPEMQWLTPSSLGLTRPDRI